MQTTGSPPNRVLISALPLRFLRGYSHRTAHSSSAFPDDWPTTQELVASRHPRSSAWRPLEREIRELATLPSAENTTSTTAVWGAGQVTCRNERSTGQCPRSLGPEPPALVSRAGNATLGPVEAARAVCV